MEIGIPTIETERLVLRPFREDDVEPLWALLQDPDVVASAAGSGREMRLRASRPA